MYSRPGDEHSPPVDTFPASAIRPLNYTDVRLLNNVIFFSFFILFLLGG